MSNYLFYTLLGYAAGLITSLFLEIAIDRKMEKKVKENAKPKEAK